MNTSLPCGIGLAVLSLRVSPGQRFIRLMPGGQFDAPRGAMAGVGPWVLTAEAAARIVARNAGRQADIVVDYEHQQLASATNGLPAPAAGWIDPRSLVWIGEGAEPGLYGAVTWTAKAAAMIAADEYRYLSPVFPYHTQTGEPTDLLQVALTNFPAIDNPIVASLSGGGAAVLPLPPDEQRSVDAFNRSFGHLGVLHPDTDRAIAGAGVSRAKYLAALGCTRP